MSAGAPEPGASVAGTRPVFALRLPGRVLELGPRTAVMGIVNVTPDSFSDGGRFLDPEAAVEQGLRLLSEGADLLDVGGESTRPGAPPVPPAEQARRVVPVIRRLASAGAAVSVDTTSAAVAAEALAAGAVIVNDVSGLAADPDLGRVVAAAGAGLVLMHLRGTPATMQSLASYGDVAGEVAGELGEALARAGAAGVPAERVIVDPGIGFAKTAAQSLELLARLRELAALGRPVLVGPSRKSFIGAVLGGRPPAERLEGTIAACCAAAERGAHLVRVHDVAPVRRALDVTDAIRGAA